MSNCQKKNSAPKFLKVSIKRAFKILTPDQSSDLMPGDFRAQYPSTSEVSQIESFGALDLTFEDAAGNPIQLAEGETATLPLHLRALT